MLNERLIAELFDAAAVASPREMCGLLFPTDGFHELINHAPDPEREFLIDHEVYLLASVNHGEKPWAIVHSHPGKGAGPSGKDCALMDALQLANQDLAMVIVGLNPIEIRCFMKDGDLYRLVWGHAPAKEPMTLAHLKKIRDALHRASTLP